MTALDVDMTLPWLQQVPVPRDVVCESRRNNTKCMTVTHLATVHYCSALRAEPVKRVLVDQYIAIVRVSMVVV